MRKETVFLVTGFLAFNLFVHSSVFASRDEVLSFFRGQALPLEDSSSLDPLIEAAADKKVVLLGEASHGTSEYYRWRTKVSRRLIEEKGFSFIVVEGDWPSCFKLNLYVKGKLDGDLKELLQNSYMRWPRWMWANEEIIELAEWLRDYNAGLPKKERVGFYGMDVYSLKESAQEVKQYLEQRADETFLQLRENYLCFQRFDYDGFNYARAVYQQGYTCRVQVEQAFDFLEGELERLSETEPYVYLDIKMNALAVKNAEDYYRLAVLRGPQGWNSRVYHMKEVLRRLLDFYGQEAKGIVWAHNTHVGDARATVMSQQNQVNIGQLSREAFGSQEVFIVGFGTYQGEVIAASQWGDVLKTMPVPPAREGSIEEILSRIDLSSFLVFFDESSRQKDYLSKAYGHRAIGVVYDSRVEHLGNYVPTRMPYRYDAFLFFRNTQALRPLGQE